MVQSLDEYIMQENDITGGVKMKKRKLGKSNLEISAIGLGCMSMTGAYGAAGLRARLGKGRLHRYDPCGGETGGVGHPWAEALDCKLASLQLIGDGASKQGAGVRKPRAPLRPHGAIKSGRNRLDLSISQMPAPRLPQFGSGGQQLLVGRLFLGNGGCQFFDQNFQLIRQEKGRRPAPREHAAQPAHLVVDIRRLIMVKRGLPRRVASGKTSAALAVTLFIIRIPLPAEVPGPDRGLNFAGISGYRVPARVRIDGRNETVFGLGRKRVERPKD